MRKPVADKVVVKPRDTNPRLTRMYREWELAEQRKKMAQQTLDGATAEALVREAKFKGAVDFIGGPDATWKVDEALGHVNVTHGTEPEPPPDDDPGPGMVVNGHKVVLHGEMSGKQMKAVVGAQMQRKRKG